jgi:hypothetical protein
MWFNPPLPAEMQACKGFTNECMSACICSWQFRGYMHACVFCVCACVRACVHLHTHVHVEHLLRVSMSLPSASARNARALNAITGGKM